jgi:hypothetical protein
LLKEIKELNSKIFKLDVLEQRILTLSNIVDRSSDLLSRLPDQYLSKADYQRKNTTDKMQAIQKDLAEFKIEVEKSFREVSEKAKDSEKSNILGMNNVQVAIFSIIISLLSSGLFFALQLVFHH